MTGEADAEPVGVVVVVDVANVIGSRPDGWWRDRAGAATRLLAGLPALVGREVDGGMLVVRIVAVIEGQAKAADDPSGPGSADVEVVRAPADGDSTIAELAAELVADGASVLVVTADRGLRARLPERAQVAGPGWVNELLGR